MMTENEPPEAREHRLARQREHAKTHSEKPEQKARMSAKRKTPEYKAYMKAYSAEWLKRPEVIARRSAYYKVWRQENREKRLATNRKMRLTRRASSMLTSIRKRAKTKGLVYDLDRHVELLQQRIDAGFCELTGYPFDLTPDAIKGSRRFDGPSIDRIDSTKGYTYDNVRVVLNIVNYGLNIWGEDVLRKVMSHWLEAK